METTVIYTKIYNNYLRLADADQDGLLDDEEFALALHLIKVIFLYLYSGYLKTFTFKNN